MVSATLAQFSKQFGGVYLLSESKADSDPGVWTLARIHDNLLMRANSWMSECANAPSLELGFFRNGNLNAVAGVLNRTDLIGINLGTIALLQDLFDAMLSRPDVLPKIGNAAAETTQHSYDPLTNFIDLSIPRKRRFQPIDIERRDASLQLLIMALSFVFLHELGHLFNGHIDLIQRMTGASSFAEINGNLPGLNAIDRQTLEWDADSFAMVDCLSGFLEIGPPNERRRRGFELTRVVRKERFFLLCFAVYALFRLFSPGEGILREDEILQQEHPPAWIRFVSLMWLTADIVKYMKFLPQSDMMRLYKSAQEQCEQAFISMGAPPRRFDETAQVLTDKGISLLQRYDANWKFLRHELDKLKRGGTLAK